MKRIFLALTFVGILAAALAAFAQTTAPTSDAAAPAASATPAKDAAPPAVAPAVAATPAAQAPAPAAGLVAADSAAPPTAAGTPPAPQAPAPAANAEAGNPPAAEAPAATPTTAAQPDAVIPLIVMDDVPLTDAIRNLARQAGLNYLLDPSIVFGQMGADGKPTPQPTVSIRWENITAGQALTALLNNYTLQLVEDPKSKIARVTKRDPAALPPLLTKIIQLKYANPVNLLSNVMATFIDKRSRVLPDIRTSQLVVVATEKEQAAVDELVQSLDTRTKQVLIEARLIETTINPSTIKGVDWTGTLAAQHVTMGNNGYDRLGNPIENGTSPLPGGVLGTSSASSSGTATTPANLLMNASSGSFFNPSMAFLNADGVSAVLSFLNTYAESRVLSTPRTVTLDNEQASIEVGTMFPIVNTTAGTANTTGGSQVTYSNLTVALFVTPRISANDYVNLKVVPSVNRLGPLVTSTVGGQNNSVYEFYTRRAETHVLIPSGNTLVMGGMIDDELNVSNVKVPFLGDIPVLGYLFRQDSKNRNKQNLMIFITPTIVQDGDFQPTKTDFLKTHLPAKDSVDDDWSAWDSGQPKDWSHKTATPDFQDPDTMTTK